MLFMLNNPSGNVCFYITEHNKEYVVGRKDCQFLINDDASVSRKHAVLKTRAGSVRIVDAGSKYKTFHNGSVLKPSTEVILHDGDEIQFGALQSKFKFHVVSIKTTGSRLNSEQNQRVKAAMKTLKGTVVEAWDDQCTHLTVHELMLSVKVLHAVLDEKPIVSVAYWDKYLECVQNHLPPPSVNKIKPPMAEALLSSISLDPDPRRKTLFTNKVFVFVTEKAMLKMDGIIKKAGGKCISWQKTPLSIEKVDKSPCEYLILQGLGESAPAGLVQLTEHLQRQGKRCIPVQEIAMAIVLCSVDKDCNSSFKRAERVFKNPFTQLTQPGVELAKETESQSLLRSQEMRKNRPNIVINSSLDADVGLLTQPQVVADSEEAGPSGKRQSEEPHTLPHDQTHPPKRIKKEVQSPANSVKNGMQTTIIPSEEVKSEIIDVDECPTSTDVPKHGVKRKSEESPVLLSKKKEKVMMNPFAVKAREDATLGTNDPFVVVEEKIEVMETPLKVENVFDTVGNHHGAQKQNVSVLVNASPDLPDTPSQPQRNSGLRVIPRSKANDTSPNATQSSPQIMSSTMNQRPTNRTLQGINVSRIARTGVASRWLRKGMTIESGYSRGRDNMDPELEGYCNSFRDCVVITPMKWYPKMDKKSVVIPDSLDGNFTQAVANFKKFRKVKPLRPQTMVLYCASPAAVDTESQKVPDDSQGYTVDDPAPPSRRRHALTAR